MSISSFTRPSDDDVLRKLVENDLIVSFIGDGSVVQKLDETLYCRIVKIKLKDEESLHRVIYIKSGVSWKFKCTEKTDENEFDSVLK